MDELRLLKLSDVICICGISKSTIQRKVNKNEFPKSLNLGGNCRRLRYIDIKKWNDKLITQGAKQNTHKNTNTYANPRERIY